MARKRKTQLETWQGFEERISEKRMGGSGRGKKAQNVPEDIMVQRMSAVASGRLKKYEPLDTRDFVPFSDFTELSLPNIKKACECFYNMPENTCDILASDRGPSCTRIEQIKTKKVYHIRFLEDGIEDRNQSAQTPPVEGKPLAPQVLSTLNRPQASKYAKSVSIADLLKAGKLIKKSQTEKLVLESFSIENMQWKIFGTIEFRIDGEKFANGAFREAFKAVDVANEKVWVIKKYTKKSIEGMEVLKLTHEEHTRKQVQMHTVARNITQRFANSAPKEFGKTFEYGKVFYSRREDLPITVEEFVEGNFIKYVNNDGECKSSNEEDLKTVFQKAQALVHFSYVLAEKKFMLLDIQGSMYQLYDPEIATNELTDMDELYFCSGNLSFLAIETFVKEHSCNGYCGMMELEEMSNTDDEVVQ